MQLNAAVGLQAIKRCDIGALFGRGEGLNAPELMCVNYSGSSKHSTNLLRMSNTIALFQNLTNNLKMQNFQVFQLNYAALNE